MSAIRPPPVDLSQYPTRAHVALQYSAGRLRIAYINDWQGPRVVMGEPRTCADGLERFTPLLMAMSQEDLEDALAAILLIRDKCFLPKEKDRASA